jgi:nucleotide-binding universal stress UspA family protein
VRILVGVDLSVGGHEWLIDRAAAWAARLAATVDLVYVLGDHAETADHRARLLAFSERLPPAHRGVVRVEQGQPADELVRMSEEYQLLVMGSRELPALERLLKGHLATRVLRQSRCAVLVPRADHEPVGDSPKLLVGVDVDGPDPGTVLRLTAEWADRLGGRVVALFAEPGHLPHMPDRDYREAAEREWHALRAPKRQRLTELFEQYVPEEERGEVLVRRGEPDEVLVELSKEHDLVIVGNRTRTGIAGFVFGPVGGQVVRRAHCDVLVVPSASVATPA